MLNQLVDSLDKYDKDMGNQSMVLIEPPFIDQRIINQYSYFSIIPSELDNIEDFLENKTSKTTIAVLLISANTTCTKPPSAIICAYSF